ncbi:MAG: ABC transporter ATP-binding protein [Proteobacteria bacterium]|nr:ABC transporter ATP-binding protein [Pseudomonadota bacterium]
MTQQILLQIDSISKTFRPEVFQPPVKSLQSLTIDFTDGECTGLVGHNGAGKTTTIRMILGLISPDKGSIKFRGQPLSKTSRSSIGYLAESVKFPSGLTCREILTTHISLFRIKGNKERKELIQETLEKVGLQAFADRKAKSMSKGMQQRLAWAQATIHEPDLLVLDEPFSGLDPVGRMNMKNWILSEKRRGLTIILCTHELPQITSLCDNIHILRQGKLVYSSSKNNRGGTFEIKNLPRYFLDISGPDAKELSQFKDLKNLPQWTSQHSEGFLLRLGFSDYHSAASWLSPCLQMGWVIVRFGDDNSATEEQLLTYFKEEFSQ